MISDDVLTQIAIIAPNLSAQDIEDLRACDPNQIARLIRTYQDMGKVPNRDAWVQLANVLQQLVAYAPLASMIISVVAAV